ncbi:MAG: phosphoribosyl-ATP diphosphatase [Fibrobacterales bacterium]
MTFEEILEVVKKRKQEMPEGSWTTKLFEKGAHGIGKKLVEEAAESWMAARFESKEECAEELSQVMYYVACMMAEKDISIDEVYKTL